MELEDVKVDELVGFSSTIEPEPRLSLPVFNWIAIDVGFVDGCGGFDIVFPRKVILR